MTNSIDGVDRALARFRVISHSIHIERHALHTADTVDPKPKTHRERPDKYQVIGIPLEILPTPAWRRQPWDKPQTPPTVRPPDALHSAHERGGLVTRPSHVGETTP